MIPFASVAHLKAEQITITLLLQQPELRNDRNLHQDRIFDIRLSSTTLLVFVAKLKVMSQVKFFVLIAVPFNTNSKPEFWMLPALI